MNVYAVGPEGSGTHMLTELLRSMGCRAMQRSLPHGGVWWVGPGARPTVFDPQTGRSYRGRLVVITRDPVCTVRSVMRRHLAPTAAIAERQRRYAVERLVRASLGPAVTYEAIVADPLGVMEGLAAVLGIEAPTGLPPVRDENAKYGRVA